MNLHPTRWMQRIAPGLVAIMASALLVTDLPLAHAQAAHQNGQQPLLPIKRLVSPQIEKSTMQAAQDPAPVPGFWDPQRRPERPDLSRISVIRFLTETDYPPFNYAAPDGTPVGF